jgi:hypothetical protein
MWGMGIEPSSLCMLGKCFTPPALKLMIFSFVLRQGLAILPRLLLNLWAQAIFLPKPLEKLRLKVRTTVPVKYFILFDAIGSCFIYFGLFVVST